MENETCRKQFREQIQHEDNLVNHRLSWLFALNGFLFTGYCFSLTAEATATSKIGMCVDKYELVQILYWLDKSHIIDNIENLRNALAILGFFSSLIILIGISSAVSAVFTLKKCWKERIDQCSKFNCMLDNVPICGDDRYATIGGLFPPLGIPVLISLTWLYTVYTRGILSTVIPNYVCVIVIIYLFFIVCLVRVFSGHIPTPRWFPKKTPK